MNPNKKIAIVTATVEKLKIIIKENLAKHDYNCAMAAIAAGCGLLYSWNQYYVDEDFEQRAKQVGKELVKIDNDRWYKDREKLVLYYDSFGLDTRGLALTYLKAIAHSGYRLVYVTDIFGKDKQPEIHKALKNHNVEYVYIDGINRVSRLEQINSVFEKYHPTDAFFYTTPNDVPATAVFSAYDGLVTRYQVNLTDHAFWLGKCAFDYCIDGRQMGANIVVNYRGIPKEHIMPMCAYYQNINYDVKFEGFPFKAEGKKVVFSGGALYKTLGDAENKYYKIVEYILANHEDVIFLYAGDGDDSELKKVMAKYPNRVYHIKERKDFYQIIERSALYLNTYPMFGGSMMRYAAMAGVVPLTLKHADDADGLLRNQANINVEFENINDVFKEADKLLNDDAYRASQATVMKQATTTEAEFDRNMKLMMDEHRTEYTVSCDYMDTSKFRAEYVERFTKEMLISAIANRQNLPLAKYFPMWFINRTIAKIFRKLGVVK